MVGVGFIEITLFVVEYHDSGNISDDAYFLFLFNFLSVEVFMEEGDGFTESFFVC